MGEPLASYEPRSASECRWGSWLEGSCRSASATLERSRWRRRRSSSPTLVAFAGVPDLRASFKKPPRFFDTLKGFRSRTLATIGALNFAATFSASGMVLTTLVLLVHARRISLLGMGNTEARGR